MIFSKTSEYAIRAMACLSDGDGSEYFLITDVSRRTGAPKEYIAKIFQKLVRQGLLESRKGPAGGFRLKRPSQEISIKEIVREVDDLTAMDGCVMGFLQCDNRKPCLLHTAWVRAKQEFMSRMDKCSLKDYSDQLQSQRTYRQPNRSRLAGPFHYKSGS